MLKLGRAQGVAIAAAIHYDIPIHEYAPLKIKMAITGQGLALKRTSCRYAQTFIKYKRRRIDPHLWMQQMHWLLHIVISCSLTPPTTSHTYRSWKDFINKNKEKIHA